MSDNGAAERVIRESRERLIRCGALAEDAFDEVTGETESAATLLARELERRDAVIEALSQERRRLEAAQQSADMENSAKSKFVANISHELRTPLNAIIGYGEILIEGLQEAGLGPETQDCQRIVGAGRHLLKLVDQVLAFSEVDTTDTEINPARVAVSDLLASLVEANQLALKRDGNSLSVDVAPDAENCFTDERLLRSCIQAVVENAIKFTQRGEIRIECTRRKGAGAAMLCFTVRDSGIGMSASQQDVLFQPFVSADDAVTTRFGGIGLGLSIARKCARLLGGDIVVSSALGQGSVFTVAIAQTFGVVESATLDPALIASVEPNYILLIDDDEDGEKTRQSLEHELGSKVVLVRQGGDALAIVRLQRPALILLDVRLAGSNGWSILESLKSNPDLAGVAVIVTTADEDRARSLRLGAALHLTKPLDQRALVAGGRRLIAPIQGAGGER